MVEEVRCVSCGEVIESGKPTIRISEGTFRKDGFKEKGPWPAKTSGLAHRSCFNRSIDSPAATMEEIKRINESK